MSTHGPGFRFARPIHLAVSAVLLLALLGLAYAQGSLTEPRLLSSATPREACRRITAIIDASGDGAGHILDGPLGIAVDAVGNVYVTGSLSGNAFRVTPSGTIVPLLDGGAEDRPLPGGAAVSVAPSGTLYLAAHASGAALRISPGSPPVRLIEGNPVDTDRRLEGPLSQALGPLGNLYVAGAGSSNVLRVSPDGEVDEILDASGDGRGHVLLGASAVAVDAAGNVYVAGRSSHNVLRLDPAGVVDEVIDAAGDGEQPLIEPVALAVDSAGNLYVAGSLSHNVFRIAPDGSISRIVDADGDRAGNPLFLPEDLALDGVGNVYVAGSGSDNVLRVAPDGSVEAIIDAAGDGAGNRLGAPVALAVDPVGTIYVAGADSDNVFRIDTPLEDDDCDGTDDDCDGEIDEDYLPTPVSCLDGSSAQRICVDGDEVDTCRRQALSLTGLEATEADAPVDAPAAPTSCTPIVAIEQIIDSSGDGTTALASPRVKGLDAAGNIYVASESNDDLFRITPGGAVSRVLDAGGDGAHAFDGFDAEEGFVIDSAGNLYAVGTSSDNVFKITPAGAVQQIIDSGGDGSHALDGPRNIAVDGSGNVYVAGRLSDNVFRITPAGAIDEILDATGDGTSTLDDPAGLAVDGAGNVYVAGLASDSVFKITPGGGVSRIIDATGDSVNPLSGIADGGFAVRTTGDVYVAGQSSNNLFQIAPGGAISQILDSTGDGVNALGRPGRITLDGAGNVFVSDVLDTFLSFAVFKVAVGGAVTRVIESAGDGVHGLYSGFGGVADAEGNFYVGGFDSLNVYKITPAGTVLQIIDANGDGTHPLSFPVPRLVAAAGGGVYVAGSSSTNVFRVLPLPDATCDGIDDDCDGTADEDFVPLPSSCGVGECAGNTGVQTCVGGVLLDSCDPFDGAAPSDPMCDGLDDDCDGTADEDYVSTPTACDYGACQSDGRLVCAGGSEVDTCVAGGSGIEQIIDAAGDGVTPLADPRIKAVDGAGHVYVVNGTTGDLFKVLAPGAAVLVLDTSGDGVSGFSGLDPLEGFALDGADNAFAAGTDSDNVFRITPAGGLQEVIDASGDGVHVLDGPRALATDSAGNLFVAGRLSDNVFRIAPGGAIDRIIGASGDGASILDDPNGLGVDAAGNAYVAGAGTDNVFKITPGGAVSLLIDNSGDGGHPLNGVSGEGFAVDPAGNVYVAGQSSNNVFRVAPDGEITQILEATGDGMDTLGRPGRISLDGLGNVYVLDVFDAFLDPGVFKITPAGAVTQIIDSSGDGIHGLNSAFGGVADAGGNFYVGGFDSLNVFRISPAGTIEQVIDAAGDGVHPLSFPVSRLALDARGALYVAGSSSWNVFRIWPAGDDSCDGVDNDCDGGTDEDFTPWASSCGVGACSGNAGVVTCGAGALVDSCDPLDGAAPADATCDGQDDDCDGQTDDDYVVTPTVCSLGPCTGAGEIQCVDGSEVDTCEIDKPSIEQIIDAAGDGVTALDNPRVKGVDTAGQVYVSGTGDNVFRVSPGGVVTLVLDSGGDGVQGFSGLNDEAGFAVDGAGNAYAVGTDSHNVFRITPGGSVQRVIDATGDSSHSLNAPLHVTVDSTGTLFVAGRLSDNVFKVTLGGAITQIIDAIGDGTHVLDEPCGLAVDGAGNVYVSGLNSGNVFRVTPAGTVTQLIDAGGDGTNPLTGLATDGLAADAAGNVYVAGRSSNNVFHIAPDGMITQILDAAGDGINSLGMAGRVSLDGLGNVFVLDVLDAFLDTRVFKIRPDGEVTQIIDSSGDGVHGLFSGFGGVADAVGNFYVGGFDSLNVFRITRNGVITQIIDGSGDGTHPLGFPVPRLAVDAADNVYVAGSDSDNVFRIPPDHDGTCDGIDDDCDGDVDEDYLPLEITCGVGGCEAVGTTTCVDGVVGEECTPAEPSAEVCDGIDNNCDGDVDEGDPGSGAQCGASETGECRLGLTECRDGLLVCEGNVDPAPEICDGLDNNCDGVDDEGNPGERWLDADFEGLAVGSDPPGWYDTDAGNSMAPADDYAVFDAGGTRALGTLSTRVNIHSHYVVPDSPTWFNYTYTGRLRLDDPEGGIGVTALSDYPNSDRYYRLRRFAGAPELQLSSHGTALSCDTGSTGVDPGDGGWYRFELQVEDAAGVTHVRAKAWHEGTPYATAWQQQCTDAGATRRVNGTVGVWSMLVGGKFWDDLAVVRDVGLQGAACGLSDVGECEFGTQQCVAGQLTCDGGVDPVTEICDGLDNSCDGLADEDSDGDGYGSCEGDCDNAAVTVFPGAPELNDGLDNQCPGDPGYGAVDEVSGESGFLVPGDKTRFSWPLQPGATLYEAARANAATFDSGCTRWTTAATFVIDSIAPPPGGGFFYLSRAVAPNPGSWGLDSAGVERSNVCP